MDGTVAGAALRWSRALVLATVAMTTAVAFHATANGLVPGIGGLLLLLVATTAAAAPLLGRPASTRRVVVLVMAWQALLHLAMTASSGHHEGPAAAGHDEAANLLQASASAANGRGSGSYLDPATMPHWLQRLVEDLTGPHMAMAVAHLAAGAVVGLWLAAGERALWTVLALASQPVLTAVWLLVAGGLWLALVATVSRSRVTLRPAQTPAGRPPAWFLIRNVPRRGPPLTA